MKLWVDDIRDPLKFVGKGWVWAKNYSIAIDYLQMGGIEEVSLDHDLGDFDALGREYTGYDIVIWMAENDVWPPNGARSHSANPIGRERIEAVIERYGPYGE
jgi:hypothetical protein